jgi:uncharacterized lipoprotein YbaY
MELLITILALGAEPLPPGSAIVVELRDTSLADAPSVTLHRETARVTAAQSAVDVPVRAPLASVPSGATVWVHVDTDGDGRVSRGDFVTVQSYPLTSAATQRLTVHVRKVQ